MSEWKRVGSVGVDSASLWLGDPGYGPVKGQAMSETCGGARYCDRKDYPHFGFYFYTLTGDGEYPVYAQFDEDGDIERVMVDLTEDA
jgi:hypothetical protein